MCRWSRFGLAVLCLVAIVLLAGAIYEQRARKQTLAQYPPLGKHINLGGRSMQIDCRGTGAPAVIFEAGRDLNGSLSWSQVHDDVATFTRACAYSRAGILWSDAKDTPNTVTGAVSDLHAA